MSRVHAPEQTRSPRPFRRSDGFHPLRGALLACLIICLAPVLALLVVLCLEEDNGTTSIGSAVPIHVNDGKRDCIYSLGANHVGDMVVQSAFVHRDVWSDGLTTKCTLQSIALTYRPVDTAGEPPSAEELATLFERYAAWMSQWSPPASAFSEDTELAMRLRTAGAGVRNWRATLASARPICIILWLLAIPAAIFTLARHTVFSGGRIGARRLRRTLCPRCQYDISKIPLSSCPECGTTWEAQPSG